jgi:hypothetical protein
MRFLLLLFFILLIVPYLLRLMAPWLLRLLGRQMGKRMQRNFEQYNRAKTADTTVKRPSPRSKKIDRNVGEYVEYEEIKET